MMTPFVEIRRSILQERCRRLAAEFAASAIEWEPELSVACRARFFQTFMASVREHHAVNLRIYQCWLLLAFQNSASQSQSPTRLCCGKQFTVFGKLS